MIVWKGGWCVYVCYHLACVINVRGCLLRSLMAGGNAVSLFVGVAFDACLPDGSIWKSLWLWWLGSFMILLASLTHCLL